MPESNTDFIDYYPDGWTEEILNSELVEWRTEQDETIAVRLEVDESPPRYYVSAITGVTESGEEFVAETVTGVSATQAFDVAETLMYAMNGTIGRMQGNAEFCGDG